MFSKILFQIKPKELFLGLFLLTAFVSNPYQLDNFYAIGWLYLSLIVFTSISFGLIEPIKVFQSALFMIIPIVYALCFRVDFDQLGIYLILFYATIAEFKTEIINIKSSIVKIVMNSIFVVWTCFLILSLVYLFMIGYNHINTYKCIVYFAHRNVFLEYGVILTYLFTQWNSFNLKQKLIIRIVYFIIVLIFQAKAAILSSLFLLVINHSILRLPLIIFFLALISYNIPNIYKHTYQKRDYFRQLETKHLVCKNLDIIYNFFYSGSATDRINTYDWTIQHLNILGHGIGSWKYHSMGNIRVEDGPNVLHRRPHNEFLLILYEYGILLGMLLCLQVLQLLRRNSILFILPIVFFSFPFERSEFVALIFLSGLFKCND